MVFEILVRFGIPGNLNCIFNLALAEVSSIPYIIAILLAALVPRNHHLKVAKNAVGSITYLCIHGYSNLKEECEKLEEESDFDNVLLLSWRLFSGSMQHAPKPHAIEES